ncbi:MAG: hypothetical protein Ct9H300mP23_10570 [Nitrospinota bacterium]|nr:MAG: hypothetical protein Ct9H300mP23_10570 [Nitrospinota bacterium]
MIHCYSPFPVLNSRVCKTLFYYLLTYLLLVGVPFATAGYSDLTLPRIIYKGGNETLGPEGLRSLLSQVAAVLQSGFNREPIALKLSDPNLSSILYLFGWR